MQAYYTKLYDIKDFARDAGSNIIVAGDVNAKAIDWGMPYTDSKGEAALLNVVVSPTFKTTSPSLDTISRVASPFESV